MNQISRKNLRAIRFSGIALVLIVNGSAALAGYQASDGATNNADAQTILSASTSATPPIPTNNPVTWVNSEDYPASALNAGIEGRTQFTLNIDAKGSVTACKVTESSGTDLLDQTACALIIERARFTPGLKADGTPVEGEWESAVRWQIPEIPLEEMRLEYAFTIEKDGSVSGCEIIKAEGATALAEPCKELEGTKPGFDIEGRTQRTRVKMIQEVTLDTLTD